MKRSFLPLALLALFAFGGPIWYRIDPTAIDLGRTVAEMSRAHPLGTDESGRDVLARLMTGGQVSLLVGILAGVVALLVGTIVGALATARHPWLSAATSRLLDAAMAVPSFFILLVTVTLFGGSTTTLVLAIGSTAWMSIARLVRAESLSLRERDYVTVARALGQPPVAVFRRHILPHLVPTLVAAASVGVAQAVLAESALSFLGLGIEPPTASWGNMLTGAQQNLSQAPWLAIYPGLLIVLTVLAVNAIGESAHLRSRVA